MRLADKTTMGDRSKSDADEEETDSRLLSESTRDDLDKGHDLEQDEVHQGTCGKIICRRSLDDPAVWRWVVVAGMFVVSFFHGNERSLGLYYVELMDYFETDSSVVSLIGSVYYTCYCFFGIFTLPLLERYGPRLMIMLGGVFLFAGFLITAFASNVYVCIATLGAFVGCGASMTYVNASSVIMFYFTKQRVLAQAIGTSGLAVGAIILPMCVQQLNQRYAWRGGSVILAAMALNVCVSGALVRPIKRTNGRSRGHTPDDSSPRDKSRGMWNSLKELLCSRVAVFLFIQSSFIQAGISILTMHMKAATIATTGVSDELGSYVISFYGGGLFIGLLSSGIAMHAINIEPIILLEIYYFCCACGVTLIPTCRTYPTMVGCICIFALFTAPNATILPIVFYDLVGAEKLRMAWALRFAFCGIGGFVGPAIAGLLYDNTKDYTYSMYLSGAGIFLSVLLMIEPCVTVTRAKNMAQLDDVKKKVREEEMWQSVTSLPGSAL
ncbi:monocarboxylate transporter 14-like [Lineus longissimus]|uniref:monocarboxylate transporter 14-like n=1 Tax=Lineus longissimus TaxID=88925 RepID=UPI002B4F2418